jgi:hypothetical protein
MKRGYIKRRVGLKQNRLQPFSKKNRKMKTKVQTYCDSKGLAFEDVRAYMQKHYGVRTADWPTVKPVADKHVCKMIHEMPWWFGACWNCEGHGDGWNVFIEAHHIVGAGRRSDELCNIALLCSACHVEVKTRKLPQGRILFLKWKYDRQHCDWARLAILRGQFLPDLITEPNP